MSATDIEKNAPATTNAGVVSLPTSSTCDIFSTDGWHQYVEGSCWWWYNYKAKSSINGIFSMCSINSLFSFGGTNAMFSLFAVNCLFGILACNSVLSILSTNSMFSILSTNSMFAIGCTNEEFKICY